MTLEMPSDPFGTPSGLFALLGPPQETLTFDDAYPPSDPSPNLDFIMDFGEAGPGFGFEMLGDGVTKDSRENEPVLPVVKVQSSTLPARPVSRRAPSMPTILEEDEQEEEDGDVTVTPSEAQRALLPPDKFAYPRSGPQSVGGADASQDAKSDSLDTPRPRGKSRFVFRSSVVTSITDFRELVYPTAAQTSAFSVPAPDAFYAKFEGEAGLDVPQDTLGQSDFSLVANESVIPVFDVSFDVDIPAWNEAVFGESPSQESISSSLSSWEEPLMDIGTGIGIDMQLQFPTVKVDTIGDGTGMPSEDEFFKAIVEAVQSSPRAVSPLSCFILPSVCTLIASFALILFVGLVWISCPCERGLSCFGTRAGLTCELGLGGVSFWLVLSLRVWLIRLICRILTPSFALLSFSSLLIS